MRDLVILAFTLGFFALCVAYVALCDRIIGPDRTTGADGAEAPVGRRDPRAVDEVPA